MALTLVTVAVSYLHLPTPAAIARGAAGRDRQGIAGGLLLHAPDLRAEADLRGAGLTVVFFVALMALSRPLTPRQRRSGSTNEPQGGPRGADLLSAALAVAVRRLVPGAVPARQRASGACVAGITAFAVALGWSSTSSGSCVRRGCCDDPSTRSLAQGRSAGHRAFAFVVVAGGARRPGLHRVLRGRRRPR